MNAVYRLIEKVNKTNCGIWRSLSIENRNIKYFLLTNFSYKILYAKQTLGNSGKHKMFHVKQMPPYIIHIFSIVHLYEKKSLVIIFSYPYFLWYMLIYQFCSVKICSFKTFVVSFYILLKGNISCFIRKLPCAMPMLISKKKNWRMSILENMDKQNVAIDYFLHRI